ncbi:MAG: hypothetical protein P0119_03165 [Nitrospira sp.]|nr:hypothetical protein [Nitrospira sp.]
MTCEVRAAQALRLVAPPQTSRVRPDLETPFLRERVETVFA